MENNNGSTEFESLGSLFRRLRMERSLDISDVSEETRIPPKTIRAIETDNYDSLPAPAFARGFYTLYAKMLDLDQDEIIRRYYEERSENSTVKQASKLPPPSWQHKNIGTMAERPSLTLGSIIGSAVLVFILLVAGIFWYIGYNPATHISQWLRTFQDEPVVSTIQTDNEIQSEGADEAVLETEPDPAVEVEVSQSGVTVVRSSTYQLAAEFPYDTQVTITIDEEETKEMLVSGESIETWYAENRIVLELPPDTRAELYLNGSLLDLPPPADGKIMVVIPE